MHFPVKKGGPDDYEGTNGDPDGGLDRGPAEAQMGAPDKGLEGFQMGSSRVQMGVSQGKGGGGVTESHCAEA